MTTDPFFKNVKAIIQVYKTGALELIETPPPQVRPGWVLVRNGFSVISAGTEKTKVDTAKKSLLGKAMARPDLVKKVIAKAQREGLWKTWSAVSEQLEAPTPLGYSCAGEVVEVAGEVHGISPGDWVACGGNTANHAEVVCVPRNLAVPIPEGVRPDAGAFATLGAIAMQGVRQADLRLGEKVAVIGLGLIGLLTVQTVKACGCQVFGIDIDPAKLKLAAEIGCDQVILANTDNVEEAVLLFTDGFGVDACLITAGTASNGPIEQAGAITREKGRVIVVGAAGMDVPREPYYMKEIDLRISRSYGPGRYDPQYEEHGRDYPFGYVRFTERRNMACFLELVQKGVMRIDPIITHRFRIEDAVEAYALLRGERREPYLGIVLEYGRPWSAIPKRVEFQPAPLGQGKIVIGVIGAGKYASTHLLPTLRQHPDVKLGSVCTASGVTARQVALRQQFAAAETDPAAVIRNSQAVLVATRHNEHARYAVQALEEGKPVYVEKPLVLTETELEQVIAAAGRAPQASVMVGFNRRFAPATQSVRAHFAGVAGPKQVSMRVNAGPIPKDSWIQDPEVGGGRLMGEGCHFVDLAVALVGSPAVSVSASAIPMPSTPLVLWDSFSITLSHADGSVSTIVYSAIGDPAVPKERIEVMGAARHAILDDFRSLELWKDGRKSAQRWSQQDKGQEAEMKLWVEGLKRGTSPIPFAELVNVHRACLGALQSIRARKPVAIDLGVPAPNP